MITIIMMMVIIITITMKIIIIITVVKVFNEGSKLARAVFSWALK